MRLADKLVFGQYSKMKVGRAIRMDSFMGDRRIVRESFEVTEEGLNDRKFTVSSGELKGVLKRPS